MGVRDDLLAVPDEDLRSGNIAEAALIYFGFKDNPRRLWTGFGDLEAGGYTWEGSGDLISVSGVTTSYGLNADPVTFDVPLTEDLLVMARQARDQVENRPVQVMGLLMQTVKREGGEAWDILIPPYSHFTGKMRQMTWKASYGSAQLQIMAEGLFHRRNAPPHGLLTDADQRARHPGDAGLERMALYEDYETRWV